LILIYYAKKIFFFFFYKGNIGNDVYEPLLQENERDAVTELLQYLESN